MIQLWSSGTETMIQLQYDPVALKLWSSYDPVAPFAPQFYDPVMIHNHNCSILRLKDIIDETRGKFKV